MVGFQLVELGKDGPEPRRVSLACQVDHGRPLRRASTCSTDCKLAPALDHEDTSIRVRVIGNVHIVPHAVTKSLLVCRFRENDTGPCGTTAPRCLPDVVRGRVKVESCASHSND